mmetsp:Transcript_12443/g.39844  ORF Transcript_12443/g.39844 Transcript_12443/m.39844 type:complete len:263 (+) Transcript_12443:527-1315(+)
MRAPSRRVVVPLTWPKPATSKLSFMLVRSVKGTGSAAARAAAAGEAGEPSDGGRSCIGASAVEAVGASGRPSASRVPQVHAGRQPALCKVGRRGRLQVRGQEREGLVHVVGEEQLVDVALVDGARVGERLPVDHLLPELLSEEHHRQPRLHLAGLLERHQLEELVEGAKAAGRNHERLHVVGHRELAREEVVELEGQLRRDVRVEPRLERQRDPHPDRLAARVMRAAVGRLHEARPAAGAHVDAGRVRRARVGVVGRVRQVG